MSAESRTWGVPGEVFVRSERPPDSWDRTAHPPVAGSQGARPRRTLSAEREPTRASALREPCGVELAVHIAREAAEANDWHVGAEMVAALIEEGCIERRGLTLWRIRRGGVSGVYRPLAEPRLIDRSFSVSTRGCPESTSPSICIARQLLGRPLHMDSRGWSRDGTVYLSERGHELRRWSEG